jgi:CBS domain-containing protein
MGTNVREVMTTRPRSVTPDTPLTQVAEVMASEDVGSVPVVREDRLVGMITDRDIVVRAVAKGHDLSSTTAQAIASQELVTLEPDEDLSEALKLMAQYQVRRLPVVTDGDRLVGVLSQADIALAAKEKSAGEMLEDISRPPTGPRTVGPDTGREGSDEREESRAYDESTGSRLP